MRLSGREFITLLTAGYGGSYFGALGLVAAVLPVAVVQVLLRRRHREGR